jgi:hypothetical protein
MTDIVDRLKACETRSLVTMSEETGQLVRSSESWVELWRCLQDAAAEIARLRLAVAECVAEKAADWKAACESAELASKEIGRLRLIDAERQAIEYVCSNVLPDGSREGDDALHALRMMLKRLT